MAQETTPRTPDHALALGLLNERWIPPAGHVVLLSLVAILVWEAVPHRLLSLWGTAVVLLVLVRSMWSHHARHTDVPPRAIVRGARLMMTVLGLVWGVGAVVLARHVTLAVFSIIVMGLAGLLAGAINTLVADRWAFPLYAVSLFGPTLAAGALLRSGDPGPIDELLIALFVAFMVVQHRRAHTSLRQRQRVEDELRNRERQLAAAQALAHVGSWELDLATNHVTWSDEAYRLYGVPAGSPVGYEIFLGCVHPDDRARVEALVNESLARGLNIEYEYRIVRPDGTVRHLFGRNVVALNGVGKPVRFAGTSLDITDRKQAEDALRAALIEVKTLRGILPICATCKRIRDEAGKWELMESYVRERTDAEFSHGLCPDCAAKTWGAAG